MSFGGGVSVGQGAVESVKNLAQQSGGLGGAGQASAEDVSKFQSALGSGSEAQGIEGASGQGGGVDLGDQLTQGLQQPGGGIQQAQGDTGPFSLKFDAISETGAKPPGGSSAIEDKIKSVFDSARGLEGDVRATVEKYSQGGDVTQAQVLEVQFGMGTFSLIQETISRGVNKVVQTVQTMIRNQ